MLDIVMPGIGGIDACNMLNGDPVGKKIPIIAISGSDSSVNRDLANKAGVACFLAKPIEKKDLIAATEETLK